MERGSYSKDILLFIMIYVLFFGSKSYTKVSISVLINLKSDMKMLKRAKMNISN